jgi:hypothetical protein
MATNCYYCGTKLSFRNSFVLNNQPSCRDCLKKQDPNQKQDNQEAGLTVETDASAEQPKNAGFFAPEKKGIEKGVLGGLAMMGIAAVWFVGGYAAGYVFYYPPILFLFGLYAFIKGLVTGNVSGKKEEELQ